MLRRKYDDMLSCFNTIPKRDRQTERQTELLYQCLTVPVTMAIDQNRVLVGMSIAVSMDPPGGKVYSRAKIE